MPVAVSLILSMFRCLCRYATLPINSVQQGASAEYEYQDAGHTSEA